MFPPTFPGGWCRPQNDGAGLRATTLTLYAQYLLQQGNKSAVTSNLYTLDGSRNGGAIK